MRFWDFSRFFGWKRMLINIIIILLVKRICVLLPVDVDNAKSYVRIRWAFMRITKKSTSGLKFIEWDNEKNFSTNFVFGMKLKLMKTWKCHSYHEITTNFSFLSRSTKLKVKEKVKFILMKICANLQHEFNFIAR